MSDSRTNKARERLAQQFIQSLEQDQLPWDKGWSNLQPPVNAEQNRKYTGVNRLILSLVAAEKGYTDNRWCTFATAKRNGWHVKKGEKGTPVEMWKVFRTDTRKSIDFSEANRLVDENPDLAVFMKPYAKNFTVFNGEQLEGIPVLEKPDVNINVNDFVDHALRYMAVELKHGGDRAYYSLEKDAIQMPALSQFHSDYDYNSTLLHEMCHATGHQSRLNRDLSGSFGSEKYAKEELRAEISSAFLMQDLGLNSTQEHIDNHKAYIQSWVSVLKKDKNELFSAIKDAQGIADYVKEAGEKITEISLDKLAYEVEGDEQMSTKVKYCVLPSHNENYPFNVQRWVDVHENGNFQYAGDGKYFKKPENVVAYIQQQSQKEDVVGVETKIQGMNFSLNPNRALENKERLNLNSIKSRAKQRGAVARSKAVPSAKKDKNLGLE